MRIKHEPAMAGMKVCIRCYRERPIVEFPVCRNNEDGRLGACQECERYRISRNKHGMTREEKREAARKQGGCLICRRKAPSDKGWVMDHDRSCCPGDKSCEKCRRGILCTWCNSAMGYAMDSPELLRKMAAYLEAHAARIGGG